MHYSAVNILDLCDEILLVILNKLSNINVLYSLIGVNRTLDRLAQDITFTQSIDLVGISSNEHIDSINKSILDRFCVDIIPRIQHNIECLILDPLSIDRVLCIGNYSKLHKLTLVNLQFEVASRIFNDESSFVHIFKYKISHLTVTINDGDTAQYIRKLSTNVFINIFRIFTNLTYLDFCLKDICRYPPTSLIDLVSTKFYPSNIIYLNVRIRNFNDCLYLLDERLCQLQTFIVEIDKINATSMAINNTRILSNLKCFSLTSYRRTIYYDNQIVPLLRQMSQLEKLTLSFIVRGRISFIDGNHLVNDILSKMPYLHTFIFNIITEIFTPHEQLLPTSDDVELALIQKGYKVNCYTDYTKFSMGQCHIYSIPFTMERIDTHSRKFPGGLFPTVHHLVAHDLYHPFEYDFFVRISQAFPLLNKLAIVNENKPEKKLTYQQICSIIEFYHLMIVDLSRCNIDYVRQFLFDFNIRLPCLNTLYIKYIDLVVVTDNFTNNTARGNCSKLQHIMFDSLPMTYSENFHNYFPLL